VWLLPVVTAGMAAAAAEGLVEQQVPGREGEGRSWLQRKRQFLALMLEAGGSPPDCNAAATAVNEAAGVAAHVEGSAGIEQLQTADRGEAGVDDGAEAAAAADASTSGAASSTVQAAAAAAAEPPTADVLYVVQPDCLIECSTQVARALGGFVAKLAAAAGLQRQLQEEPLCMLLEKLLMVQVRLRRVYVFDDV
jgi:hypothetical protein